MAAEPIFSRYSVAHLLTFRKNLTQSALLSHKYCYASNDDLEIYVGDVHNFQKYLNNKQEDHDYISWRSLSGT